MPFPESMLFSDAKILCGLLPPEVLFALLATDIAINTPKTIHGAQVAKEKLEKEQLNNIYTQNKHHQEKLYHSKNPQNDSKSKAEDHRRQNGNGNHYKHQR